ncbi:BAI1-associated protein 3 [Hyalella azteca]|uniref:BAI1-associated protein 3 n=1 Tax=Hyalella azteca TaxID=294128 RepID=A0A979FXT5_HYAAZ|nr:BAI1-associated protein 3 [Hyalella azteca]
MPEVLASFKSNETQLSKDELESLLMEVVYTIRHKVGMTTQGCDGQHMTDQLTRFAQQAFPLDPSTHARLMQAVREEKSPILVLNVIVVEAEGLEAKDPNGFSDPYCMLGIQPAVNALPPPSPQPPTASPPALDSPKLRSQWSRSSQETETEGSDGGDSPRCAGKDSLRKHHSFRISFKRRGGSNELARRDHRDSLTNVIPVKIIRATGVKPHTLNPRWAEKFRLDIDSINTDILHLDIWDHDDESSVLDVVSKLNEVKGVKGLGRFFKQIAQSARSGGEDDFLGCVNIPLADIPSTGVDRWYKLEARSQRSNIQGQIHLKMWLSTREDRGTSEEEVWREVQQHEQIVTVFVLHELSKWKDDSLGWDGSLAPPAETILHQHALQGDLTRLQQAVCRFMAYTRVHRSRPLDHRILLRLLTSLHELWDDEALSKEEALRKSKISTMPEFGGDFIYDSYRYAYRTKKAGLVSVQRNTSTDSNTSCNNSTISQYGGSTNSIGDSIRALSTASVTPMSTHEASREGATSPYGRAPEQGAGVRKNLHAGGSGMGAEEAVEKLARMTLQLSLDLQNGIDYYEHSFEKSLRIPYVNTLYRIWEKQLTENTLRILSEYQRGENLEVSEAAVWNQCAILTEMELSREPEPLPTSCSPAPFILYLALAEFSRFQEHLTGSGECSRTTTGLTLGCVWRQFSPSVSCWLDHTCYTVLVRIRRAILTDRVANTGEPVQYTTSAVDVTSCFYHVKTFWRHLAWPDPSSAYNLILKIIQLISLAAEYYVSLLQQRLLTLPNDTAEDQRAQQLCITVNNMEHVRHSYTLLEEDLQINELSKCLEAEDPQNGRAWGDHLIALLQSGLSALDARIGESMLPVSDKMRQELQRDVFHLAWSPDSLPAREAVRPLLEHLRTALTVYAAALLKNNLDRLLHLLWQAVLLALTHQITKDSEIANNLRALFSRSLSQETSEEETTEKQSAFFLRLYDALTLLKEFFHAGGRGLEAAVLECQEYAIVETQLRLHKTTTSALMERYYLERLLLQERAEGHQFGSLFVRVYFNHDSLCVEILQARNVIPLDPNGLSDPFVVVELVPRRLFPTCCPQHTNVHKRTLNPLFDECFEFPATLQSCQAEGAMIVFTLMDHDVITCNDFGGEAFLSLNTIPGVASSSTGVDTLHGLKPIELALMFRNDPDNLILKVLETRVNDKIAQEFVKKQKQRLISKIP